VSGRAPGRGLPALAAGAAGLAVSILLLVKGQPWVRLFFYLPAWWSTLLLIAGLNRARGRPSPMLDDPSTLLRMALFSVPAWLLYEAINLRIHNWEYWSLPEPLWLRWAGYSLAFATVLPAILESAEPFRSRAASRAAASRAAAMDVFQAPPLPKSFDRLCFALGVLFLALPLLWPRFFFPLVWGFAVLLLEPRLARRRPGLSWLAAFREGRRREVYALLVSGLVCGLLWESLNYWAGGKWRYTVPWPRGPKLFEMPLAGYGGFPPFALGCATVWRSFDAFWSETGTAGRLAAAAALCALSLLALRAMDLQTVRSLAPLPL